MVLTPNKNIALVTISPNWQAGILTTLKVFLVASSTVLFLTSGHLVLAAGLQGKEMELIQLTNQLRQNQGVSMLAVNPELTASALLKAQDMAKNSYFGHANLAGNRMAYWIKLSGYNYLRAGENLAKGFTNTSDLMTAWVNSPTHYANLINDNYQEIGVGMAQGYLNGKFTIFVVQHLGQPMPRVDLTPTTLVASINNIPNVLGDNLTADFVPSIPELQFVLPATSTSESAIVNDSPAGTMWLAYEDIKSNLNKNLIPSAYAAVPSQVILDTRGYGAAQILFVVSAFLGFWGWLSMLMWPIYAWLEKLKSRI